MTILGVLLYIHLVVILAVMTIKLMVELVIIPSFQEVKAKHIIDSKPQLLQSECISQTSFCKVAWKHIFYPSAKENLYSSFAISVSSKWFSNNPFQISDSFLVNQTKFYSAIRIRSWCTPWTFNKKQPASCDGVTCKRGSISDGEKHEKKLNVLCFFLPKKSWASFGETKIKTQSRWMYSGNYHIPPRKEENHLQKYLLKGIC